MWLQLVYRCVPSLSDGEAAAAFLTGLLAAGAGLRLVATAAEDRGR
jgi:hypothetical protein